MNIDACAELVQRGDPDRFRAVMAAPRLSRGPLLVLYAFNLEVARAPWVTKEPMIAEMRLQWWRDIIAEAADQKTARAHEVAGPLHALILEQGLPVTVMDRLIAARRHDAWGQPFDDQAAFDDYLEDTGAGLSWLAARALGAPDGAEGAVRGYGWAAGLANYFRAVPELMARGRQPLPDPGPEAVAELAERGLDRLRAARAAKARLPKAAAPALLPGWQADAVLTRAARHPGAVTAGALELSEFEKRGRLLWQAFSGRW